MTEEIEGGAPPVSALGDQELFDAAVGGDEQAMEEWYRRYPGRELPVSGLLPKTHTLAELEAMSRKEQGVALYLQTRGRKLTPDEKRMVGSLKSLTTIRKTRIVELSAQGFSVPEISTMMHTAVSHVRRVLNDALKQAAGESTEILRQRTTKRLDRLLQAAWPWALGLAPGQEGKPDWEAMAKCLEIERDRRRLLGLDAPEKIDVRVLVQQIAEVRGYSPEQTEQAVTFVERMLREMRGTLGTG